MNKRKVVFIAVCLMTVLVGTVSAAFVMLKPVNYKYEAMAGGALIVTNSIIIHDEGGGFVVLLANSTGRGTSRSDPVYFNKSMAPIAQNPQTAGNWALDIRLNTTASTPANSVFEVQFRAPAGYWYATLYVATGPIVEPNAMIICLFEIGPTLGTQYCYRVTVQKL